MTACCRHSVGFRKILPKTYFHHCSPQLALRLRLRRFCVCFLRPSSRRLYFCLPNIKPINPLLPSARPVLVADRSKDNDAALDSSIVPLWTGAGLVYLLIKISPCRDGRRLTFLSTLALATGEGVVRAWIASRDEIE